MALLREDIESENDVVLERTCQENCSARTDSILLCGFDTVL